MENKFGILSRIKEIYEKGGNIIQFLKGSDTSTKNSLEDILISYDFQAGSYVEYVKNHPDFIENYSKLIASEFKKLNSEISSIMEVGVGEATTLANVVEKLDNNNMDALGFDISWSRIHYGNKYIKDKKLMNVDLFTGDLFNIPLSDNSIDIVYTSHTLEPNSGREREALEELYRVTNKFLILIEPAYELVNAELQKRMDSHGYVKNLVGISRELGYKIIENRAFELYSNKLNPSQIIIIEKQKNNSVKHSGFSCPITKTKLNKENEAFYYSTEGLLVYPIIKNIPCLLPQNAIVATHLKDF
ncbi:MAG: methyltransferase domain-containing protein [Bacteroidetes bacterium]|nr:methyltransferase domain-containing protein [Bacteroidota bacterium]